MGSELAAAVVDEPRRRARWPLFALLVLAAVSASSTVAVAMSGADAAHVESGVYVAGTLVAGKDDAALRTDIAAIEARVARTAIPIVLAGRTCGFDPAAASFHVDVDATARAALDAGRPRGLVDKVRAIAGRRIAVPLAATFDEQAFSEAMSECEKRLIDDLPVEGGLAFDGLTPRGIAPRAGHRIRRDDLHAAIVAAVATGSETPIELPMQDEAPRLSGADVKAAVDAAQALAKGPITLSRAPTQDELDEATRAAAVRDRQIAEMKALSPKTKKKHKKKKGDEDAPPPKIPPLVTMPKTIELTMSAAELVAATRATVESDPPRLDVHLDPADVGRKLGDVATDLADSARDASFDIDDKDHVTVVPSRTGTRVDPAKVASALRDAAMTSDRRGELPVDHGAEPALTTADAEKLGIKGLVASFTTHHPCCQPRVVNIHRIADLMDGVIVKPGDTFSVNKFVGPRTVERGFVVAPSIGDGEMVDTVGGGISQFATTLFNSLFDGGYAIKERKAHSYWFNRYPMGIEATLSDPSPDLVFENDTDAGILIKTKYDKTSITVRLYGDNGGRKTERHVSGVFDVTQPKTEYEANDHLDPDEEKVVDKGMDGWSVWVTRVILMPSGERREEKRKITYNARPRTVRVHSCKIPKGEPDYTGKACPKKKDDDGGDASSSASTGTGTGAFDPNAVDPTLAQ